MKSFLVVILFTAISASVLDSRSFFNVQKSLQSRQSTFSCTTRNDTYIKLGQSCSTTSGDDCLSNLVCATTNGGSAYTCQYLTPSSSCSTTSDCGGLPCTSGKCQFPVGLPGQSCSSDNVCLSSQCVSGSCVALASGASCSDSITCAKGYFCSANRTSNGDGVCTARIANGGNCLPYTDSVDDSIICANGDCLVSGSGSTGVCTAIASISAGTTFSGDSSFCSSNTYAVRNSANNYTCVSAAPGCNDQYSCNSNSITTCNCPSSGTGNGTCSALTCVSQTDSAIKCVYGADFGVYSVYAALYSNGQCGSQYKSYLCCASDATTYIPSSFCSSSVMVAPMIALIVAVIALAF